MDRQTFDFYQNRAREWAAALPGEWSPQLDAFLDRLPPGASILELGCGDGRDAARMIARGFDVHPTDGVPQMAALASERIGRAVKLMRFEELEVDAVFDAVWAHAALLHADRPALPGILERVHRALKPGGLHFASYKGGSAGGRDEHGRYYNYISAAELAKAYDAAADWAEIAFETTEGGSFGGGTIEWTAVTARK